MQKTDVTFYQPIPEESNGYRKRRYSFDLSTPAESHIAKVEQKTGFRSVRETDVTFYQPTPEESYVYRKHRYSFNLSTPAESHV